MALNHYFDEYLNIVKENPSEYHQDYQKMQEALEQSTAKFQGETIPFLYQPMFFTNTDIEAFRRLTQILMGILTKVIKHYLKTPTFRKGFGFSKRLEELILTDPGYGIPVPMARLDLFYYGPNSFKFCELNADGSSGMHKTNVLERAFLSAEAVLALQDKYQVNYFELVDRWIADSLQNFHQFNSQVSNPNVAIVDWGDAGNIKEFEAFQGAYQAKGCKAVIADPRQLKYNGSELLYQDMKVDLIYRRLVTSELIERHSEIADLIQAYQDRAVCMVGPLRSEVIHNKIIFKILHQDATAILTVDEQEFIKRHIPYTAEFLGDEGLFKQVLRNKNDYVLKPKDAYAAAGVYLGKDFGEGEWREKVEQCWAREYLVQEYCQPFCGELVDFQQGGAGTAKFNQMIGLFVYNEKFAGVYTRVGRNNVISHQHGYYILPNYVIDKR